jgi:flagellar hook-length control protein FliK
MTAPPSTPTLALSRDDTGAAPTDTKLTVAAAPAAGDAPAASTVPPHVGGVAETVPGNPVKVDTPVAAPGWSTEVAQTLAHVILLHNRRVELQLNPAHLGPVEVRISFSADQPSLVISAADPRTRSALEQSLPQLRDLLAAQGITLGQATVQGEARQTPQTFTSSPAPRSGPTVTEPEIPRAVLRVDRLVDVFA